jgi:hypothetical protein
LSTSSRQPALVSREETPICCARHSLSQASRTKITPTIIWTKITPTYNFRGSPICLPAGYRDRSRGQGGECPFSFTRSLYPVPLPGTFTGRYDNDAAPLFLKGRFDVGGEDRIYNQDMPQGEHNRSPREISCTQYYYY